jgi:TonB family protein
MIQYILESIAFQLLFLIIYDLFLKKETFFQWNRVYLIGTYVLSMVLPWVKIEALKTKVPEVFASYPSYLLNTNNLEEIVVTAPKEIGFNMPWELVVFFIGTLLAIVLFIYKLYQIHLLKRQGEISHFPEFTKVIIKNSEVAFSFFKSIFLGDKVISKEYDSIIKHEMVHIKQCHSYDLIFFETLRILNWFNPLVYIYQYRISELHEFIADAQVSKTLKKEHYQILLSQVFHTKEISFINPFFKSSLIKKRIVMLQKSKSKKILQLKYLILIPLLLGMLFYTSMASENSIVSNAEIQTNDNVKLINNITNETEQEKIITNSSIDIPFSVVDEVPIFPGCEDAEDKRACFQNAMYKHISKNFKYPEEAQKENIQGKVNILFTIDTDGSIVNLKMRGPSPILETEAKRIIDKLPKIEPGKHKGEIVRVPFSIPITFKLDDSDIIFKKIPEDSSDDKKIKELIKKHNRLIEEREDLLKDKKEDSKIKIQAIEKALIKSELGIKNMLENENTYNDSIYVPFSEVDEVPVFPGCEDAEDQKLCFQQMMYKHISKNFQYPKLAQELGIQGKVNTMFVIGKDGVIKDIRKRGPSSLLEEETVRIIERLPVMKPGKQKGKAVDVPFSIPVTFKLYKNSEFDLVPGSLKSDNSLANEFIDEINSLIREREMLVISENTDSIKIENLETKINSLRIKIESELVKSKN